MPIYMDRHDVSEEVTAEHVATIHKEDLKIQDEFNCKGLTYWFDEKRKMAFCLIEAPNAEAIERMHDKAHGDVPNKIIEVDESVVESFLGRIEDPEGPAHGVIDDPAFRIIMVLEIKITRNFKDIEREQLEKNDADGNVLLEKIINRNGRPVRQSADHFLVSFNSVTNAIRCALEIQAISEDGLYSRFRKPAKVTIGLGAGVPVNEKGGIFEDTIRTAERLCYIAQEQVMVTSEVIDLYESENLNTSNELKRLAVLNSKDEKFLNSLMDYTEREWCNTHLQADDISKNLGQSRSQLYRKMISLTGRSPNNFIKEYRLSRALKLLDKNVKNISEVAYETGFNSPAYFSKCFNETFGLLPSQYIRSYHS